MLINEGLLLVKFYEINIQTILINFVWSWELLLHEILNAEFQYCDPMAKITM